MLPEFTPSVCLLAFLPGATFFASAKKNRNGKPLGELPIMSIENPTLAHFRHLRHFRHSSLSRPSTSVENALQISYFLCKTNPILSAVGGLKMNVSIYLQTAYENKRDWTIGENKPNSNPIKPCPELVPKVRSEFTLGVIEGNGPISKQLQGRLALQRPSVL